MKLLHDIVEMASGDQAKTVTILRKCLVVAASLKNDALRTWAIAELNGYANVEEMPDYRVIGIVARGLLIGSFGAQINDQPLPSTVMKENHRGWATTAYLRESISAYEAIAADPDASGSARQYWPADLVAYYQSDFIRGYALNRAWQDIPVGALVAVVDTVRTRVLQFALDLQSEVGSAEEVNLPAETIDRSVQTIIYGGTNLVGSVNGDVQLVGQQIVVPGDLATLTTALKQMGVQDTALTELVAAIHDDQVAGAEKGFGARVAAWLQKAGGYIGKEGAKAGIEVAQKAVTSAVLSYFGLGGGA